MPRRPPKPCAEVGCGALVLPPARRCATHQTAEHRRWQELRGTAAQRGYGAGHRRWREVILARDPTCRDPEGRHPGEVRDSVVADHIVPLEEGGDWSYENGQGLCLTCHNAKTAHEVARRRGRA